MNPSQRYKKILEENRAFEQTAPYNFCDRWCERCIHETQMRCRVYLNDLERRVSCIAHGRDEDDPEITEAVMHAQYGDIDEKLRQTAEKFNVDLDNIAIEEPDEEDLVDFEDLPPKIQNHINFVRNHKLPGTAERYSNICCDFLKETYYNKQDIDAALRNDFEVISWYCWLLPPKVQRAIAGFHEPMSEGDLGPCDAVAQCIICKKAIRESIKSFKNIQPRYLHYKAAIQEMLALLGNMLSRIELLEESI